MLTDGRRLELSGSNDVDSSIRGIFVEDPRFGRVRVSWDAFEHVEFIEHDSSGRGYGDYPATRSLVGQVKDHEGRSYSGEIVFELDETHDYESLNGERAGVDYFIPFSMVRSIVPGPRNASEIVLKSGLELQLRDSQDVAEDNAGVVVLRESNAREVYLPWRDVERIEFK